jgi:hypothetical protein
MFPRNVSADLPDDNTPNLHHRQNLKSICLRGSEAAVLHRGYTPLLHADIRLSSHVGKPMAIRIIFSWSRVSIFLGICVVVLYGGNPNQNIFFLCDFQALQTPNRASGGGGGRPVALQPVAF